MRGLPRHCPLYRTLTRVPAAGLITKLQDTGSKDDVKVPLRVLRDQIGRVYFARCLLLSQAGAAGPGCMQLCAVPLTLLLCCSGNKQQKAQIETLFKVCCRAAMR